MISVLGAGVVVLVGRSGRFFRVVIILGREDREGLVGFGGDRMSGRLVRFL